MTVAENLLYNPVCIVCIVTSHVELRNSLDSHLVKTSLSVKIRHFHFSHLTDRELLTGREPIIILHRIRFFDAVNVFQNQRTVILF